MKQVPTILKKFIFHFYTGRVKKMVEVYVNNLTFM